MNATKGPEEKGAADLASKSFLMLFSLPPKELQSYYAIAMGALCHRADLLFSMSRKELTSDTGIAAIPAFASAPEAVVLKGSRLPGRSYTRVAPV